VRAAGRVLGGGGPGGEVIYDDPTSAAAVAALAAGEWIHIRKAGQLPSAASTFADALLLGTIPAGFGWALDGRWIATFVASGILSSGIQVFRASIGRSSAGNAANGLWGSTGVTGAATGTASQFRVDTNAIYIQTRITAAQPYTYNLDFWMAQLAGPV
jgi:hypothetical protein